MQMVQARTNSRRKHHTAKTANPAQTWRFQYSDRIQPSRNYSTSKWSLFSDGSSLTAVSGRSRSFSNEG